MAFPRARQDRRHLPPTAASTGTDAGVIPISGTERTTASSTPVAEIALICRGSVRMGSAILAAKRRARPARQVANARRDEGSRARGSMRAGSV